MQQTAVVTAAWAGGCTFVEEQCNFWEHDVKYDDRQGRDALTRRNSGIISTVLCSLGTQHNWEGNQRCKSKLLLLVMSYTILVNQTSVCHHAVIQKWPERCCTRLLSVLLWYPGLVDVATTFLLGSQPCYDSLYSSCTPHLSIHTHLRHWTCKPCTALWGCMDRCGLPRPHSKLGKSKPVQIWKSCICTDLTTWAQPWATPATQIPEVGGIQLAWKVSEANVCLSAPVLVNIYESTASLLGK